jgi:hypothetical protein
MPRMVEDPGTRRVVDTDNQAYQWGVRTANACIDRDPSHVPAMLLESELMMEDLVAEDPDVREHWGIYLVLKGIVDTIRDYNEERST